MATLKTLQTALFNGALALLALGAPSSQRTVFHTTTPAGYDVLRIQPGGAVLTFLGLIECPGLEGAEQTADGTKTRINGSDGRPITDFPSNFSFRITASLRKTLLLEPTDVVRISEAPQDFLLKLRFVLKVYHGLEVRKIQPASVQMIGVPAGVPYDERVYRANFTVNGIPVTDRCVLEVLSPDGARLTRFPFDLL